MTRNITLSVDESVLDDVKAVASEQRTTVNAMVRAYLGSVAAKRREKDDARAALLKLAREAAGDMGSQPWNREALYER